MPQPARDLRARHHVLPSRRGSRAVVFAHGFGADPTRRRRVRPAVARRRARAIFLADHRDALSQLALLTPVLPCRDDAIVPVDGARRIEAHVRGSELRRLEATGPFPHTSPPAEVIGAVQSWLHARGP